MKYFICADVHGYFDEWMYALDNAGFDKENPEHIIVNLGDIIDRGRKPEECLDFINSIPKDRKILIKGNHEVLMEDLIDRGFPMSNDISNGTARTVERLTRQKDELAAAEDMQYCVKWKKYISDCVDYYEVGDAIFVHGWIPCRGLEAYGKVHFPEFQENWREGNWEKARWFNGMYLWDKGIRVSGKTIYCGHWHTSWGHSNLHGDGKEFFDDLETCWVDPETGRTEPHVNFKPFRDEGICALDACTTISKFVNCEVIDIP